MFDFIEVENSIAASVNASLAALVVIGPKVPVKSIQVVDSELAITPCCCGRSATAGLAKQVKCRFQCYSTNWDSTVA